MIPLRTSLVEVFRTTMTLLTFCLGLFNTLSGWYKQPKLATTNLLPLYAHTERRAK